VVVEVEEEEAWEEEEEQAGGGSGRDHSPNVLLKHYAAVGAVAALVKPVMQVSSRLHVPHQHVMNTL
jgi:hypothetical protein